MIFPGIHNLQHNIGPVGSVGTAAVATFDGRGAAAARCSADTRRDTADKMISRQQRPYLDVQRTFLIFFKQSINP